MKRHDVETPATQTRRVERFFARVGLVFTSLLLTAALVNAACFVFFKFYDAANERRERDKRAALINRLGRPRGAEAGRRNYWWDMMSASPAYDSFPWAEEFWREERAHYTQPERTRYAPYRLWRTNGPFRGRFVNVDEQGFRVSPDAPPAGESFNLFVLGGSTVYGTGSPDSETIPAHLARAVRRRLEASGDARPVRVRNLGVHAYNSNQEVLLLIELLRKGERPDLVVFYDGANDAATGPRLHWDYQNIKSKLEGTNDAPPPAVAFLQSTSAFRLASAVRKRLSGATPKASGAQQSAPPAADADEALRKAARETLDNWLGNRKIVGALAEAYSFRHLFVWQPSFFYGRKPLAPSEKLLAEHPELVYVLTFDRKAGERFGRAVREVYREAERRASQEDFLFLADAFDNIEAPVYIDWVHTAPRGNEVVASRIADHLETKKYPPFDAR